MNQVNELYSGSSSGLPSLILEYLLKCNSIIFWYTCNYSPLEIIAYQTLYLICSFDTYPNSKPTAKITTTLTNPMYIQVKFLDKIFLHSSKGTSSCAMQHHKMKNHINPNAKDETIGLNSSLRLHLSLKRGMLHLAQTL